MGEETLADLEIRIFPRQAEGYPVEITLDGQQKFPRGFIADDILAWDVSDHSAADGQRLFDTVFADPKLRSAWEQARGQTPRRRIRLWIDVEAPELHKLPWESLYEDTILLSASADTPFSRYLPVPLPWGKGIKQHPLRILVVISSPTDLDLYNLVPLDIETERQALQEALAGSRSESIQLEFLDPPITPERLEAALRQGYHGLHYLGHGRFSDSKQQAALYLQDKAGNTHIVTDAELVAMLSRQSTRPRLIFLATCQSASRSEADAFLGLAPRLIAAGVPSVVAMQDVIAVEAARRLSEVFYQQLAEHGFVDLAMNEARSTLLTAGHPDAAVPVLFMRCSDGQILSSQRTVINVLANMPVWSRLVAAAIALLLILVLGAELLSKIITILPTPTPDLLPLIAPTQAANEYLILVADYNNQGEYEAGYRIARSLNEHLAPADADYSMRVAWKEGVVIRSTEDAQIWGKRHNATAVIWGWSDTAGFNSYYQLMDAESVPVFDLPEEPFDTEEQRNLLSRYIRTELPAAATYLALFGTGLKAAYEDNGDYSLALLAQAEIVWDSVDAKEQTELAGTGMGIGDLYWFRGWIYNHRLYAPEDAIATLEHALKIEGPHIPLTYYDLGLTFYDLGEFEAALRHLQTFTAQCPDDLAYLLPTTYQKIGNLFNELGRVEEAESAYNEGTALDPNEPSIPLARGWYAYLREDLDLAETFYQQATDINPDYPWPHFNLALVYLLRDDVEAAQKAYARAVQLSPNWFGDLQVAYEEALTNLDDLVTRHPELKAPAAPLYQILEDAINAQ